MRWVVMFVFLLEVPSVWAGDDPYSFLEATTDRVSTAIAALQTGEMDLEYHMSCNGAEGQRFTESLHGTVMWSGDSRHADYSAETLTISQPGQQQEKVHRSGMDGLAEIIQTPKMFCWHLKDSQWCRRQTLNPQGGLSASYCDALNPSVYWFSTAPSPKHNHVKFGLTWRADHPSDDLT